MYATDRAEWSKYAYIKQMYDVIYDEMVNAKITARLVNVGYMDRDGNLVSKSNALAYGMPVDMELIHPE